MQPYSIDLRQKIIEVYEEEKLSIRKIAERFLVAKSFVQKLVKQFQKTGDIKPKRGWWKFSSQSTRSRPSNLNRNH